MKRIRVKTRVDFNKRQIEEIVSEWLFEKKIMNDDDSIGHSWVCGISETLNLLTINITKKLDGDDLYESTPQAAIDKVKRFVRVIAQSKGKRFSEISRYLWTDKSDGEIYEIFENEFETKLITELFNSSATNLLTIIGKGNGTWMVTESKQIKIDNELASLYQVKFDGYADCIVCDESEEWVREYRIENFAKKAKFNGISKLFDFKENDVRILQSGNELIRVKGENEQS